MRIYLDDIRDTPATYTRTYTVKETIDLILANNGNIEILSLDNDLGEGIEEGYKVLDYIEEHVELIAPIPHISIHSANPVARKRMEIVRERIQKKWKSLNHINK